MHIYMCESRYTLEDGQVTNASAEIEDKPDLKGFSFLLIATEAANNIYSVNNKSEGKRRRLMRS